MTSRLAGLNSHELSVISSIVQHADVLPSDFLKESARTAGLSKQALAVVDLLLDEAQVNPRASRRSAAGEQLANEFRKWASRR